MENLKDDGFSTVNLKNIIRSSFRKYQSIKKSKGNQNLLQTLMITKIVHKASMWLSKDEDRNMKDSFKRKNENIFSSNDQISRKSSKVTFINKNYEKSTPINQSFHYFSSQERLLQEPKVGFNFELTVL
uniref:Uncharacterized protein n=1 Tax=Schmidtea mediterranea TaxID=79327 RepID=I1ZIH7_SCHMD|nr:hypothetical protein [Schmidtea mediterranea]